MPDREEEEEQSASPDPGEPWEPAPYDPDREYAEPDVPAGVP